MRAIGRDALGALVHQCLGGIAQRPARIDDIVDQDAEAPFHVADDVHDFGFAGAFAALVDDRQRCVLEPLGERSCAYNAADIGRYDHQLGRGEARLDVGAHHRRAIEIVGRNIEKALDLPGVEIDRQDAVGARCGDDVGDELGRNRRARPGFAVLPGIAEIGHNRGDPARRGAFQRVDADQQFHEVVVRRIGGRLDDEDVLAANVLVNFDEHFLVGEAAHARFGQRHVEIVADRPGQREVAVARKDFHDAAFCCR